MTKVTKYHKFDVKSKKKSYNYVQHDEEYLSLKEVKRDKEHKQYRNYENALRSKNVQTLLQYEDD
jgi:hypothetical protein